MKPYGKWDKPCSNEVDLFRPKIIQHLENQKVIDLGYGGNPVCEWADCLDMCEYPKVKNNIIIADLRKPLPIDDCEYDIVFSSHALEDLEDTVETLKEWSRILKPGGKMILYLPDRRKYPLMGTAQANPGHKHDFLAHDIIDIAHRFCGLAVLEYYDITHNDGTIDDDMLCAKADYVPPGVWSFGLVLQKPEERYLRIGVMGHFLNSETTCNYGDTRTNLLIADRLTKNFPQCEVNLIFGWRHDITPIVNFGLPFIDWHFIERPYDLIIAYLGSALSGLKDRENGLTNVLNGAAWNWEMANNWIVWGGFHYACVEDWYADYWRALQKIERAPGLRKLYMRFSREAIFAKHKLGIQNVEYGGDPIFLSPRKKRRPQKENHVKIFNWPCEPTRAGVENVEQAMLTAELVTTSRLHACQYCAWQNIPFRYMPTGHHGCGLSKIGNFMHDVGGLWHGEVNMGLKIADLAATSMKTMNEIEREINRLLVD